MISRPSSPRVERRTVQSRRWASAIDGGRVVLAPFRPSTTLDNVLATGCAAVQPQRRLRVFAGCLTGRRDWPTCLPARRCVAWTARSPTGSSSWRGVEEDDAAPAPVCDVVLEEQTHAPFRGFNRAQAAVIEAAILVSRLHMLPPEKIDAEMDYLAIAIDKTAGPREREAWSWLVERIDAFRAERGRR